MIGGGPPMAAAGLYPVMLRLESAVLLAGKVHGSLARAGKVRSQTPKVAKAEKKKNPKGRAAQRVKYNRRFVNVGEYSGSSSKLLLKLETCMTGICT